MTDKTDKPKMIRIDIETFLEFKSLCSLLDIRLKLAATEAVQDWMEKKRAQLDEATQDS